MSLPLVYQPRPGEFIRVSRSNTGDCLIGISPTESGPASKARIAPGEVPPAARLIAAAMHEAAGLPSPVILERPEPRDLLVPIPGNRSLVDVRAVMQPDGWPFPPKVDLAVGDAPSRSYITLTEDEPLRVALALVDAMNGRAEDEPDQAEVEEVAEVIRSADPTGRGYSPDPQAIARAVLRHQRDKQQREERA